MTDTQTAPEHIDPTNITLMTSDALDLHLEALRERRLASVRHYEAAQIALKQQTDDKLRDTLAKQVEMCQGNIIRADKAIAALENRVGKLRALRMELGID